jgi:hypothetical protein
MRLFSSIVLVLLCLGFTKAKAQYYNNANNELSYQLYEQNDNLGKYRVYIVIEDLSIKDNELIQKWDSIQKKEKIIITENWANEGKRIEVEHFPYISYYPIFVNKIINPKLFPVYRK